MISLTRIISFIDNHLRPIECGEELIKAGYFVKYGIVHENEEQVSVQGLCLQSSFIREKPHEINIIMGLSSSNKVLKASCSCKAGATGKCKHAVGMMIILSRTELITLPKWSATDKPCLWAKINQNIIEEMVAPKPLKKFCHFPFMPDENSQYANFDENLGREMLLAGFPNSALAKHLTGRGTNIEPPVIDYDNEIGADVVAVFSTKWHPSLNQNGDLLVLSSLSQNVINFYHDFVCVSLEDAKKIYYHTKKQNGVTWKKFRQVRITGYKSYSIFTYSKNKNPDWAKQFENIFFPSFFGNAATKYGKQNEPKALKIYATQCEGEVITEAGLLVRSEFSWLGYSVDGIHKSKDNVLSLLEVKCPVKGATAKTLKDFVSSLKCIEKNSLTTLPLKLKQKHPFYGQIQLGLLLYNFKSGKLLMYWKKEQKVVEILVPFDETFANEFISCLRIVYFEHLLPYLYANKERLLIYKFGVCPK